MDTSGEIVPEPPQPEQSLEQTTDSSQNRASGTDRRQDVQLLDKPEIIKVMNSDVAINALLFNLKQSLLTCEEFIKFVKKKCLFENDHVMELSKHYKHFFQETQHVSSLKRAFHSVLEFDGKLAKIKLSYVKALQKMCDEVSSLLLTMTRLRKNVKEDSKRLERDVVDSIHNAEKAQARYVSLCQDYDKLKMTDPTKTKLTLRGSKTTKEQEEELLRKIDGADIDYRQKVDHSNSLRDNFLKRERPRIVAELKDLILEMDTAMAIQLQKYSIYTETLILNSGVSVSPFEKTSHSMKSYASSVRNEKDLYDFLNKYNGNGKNSLLVNKSLIPVSYKKHPSMERFSGGAKKSSPKFVVDPSRNSIPKRQISTHDSSPFDNPTSNPATSPSNFSSPTMNSSFNGPIMLNSPTNNNIKSATSKHTKSHLQHQPLPATPASSSNSMINNGYGEVGDNYGGADDNDDAGKSFQSLDPGKRDARIPSIPATVDTTGTIDTDRPLSQVQTNTTLPPGIQRNLKTFGVPLESLIEFEQDMVPAIVRQCVFVVDEYGLDLEGIYRKSANVLDVSKLRENIDSDPANVSMILPPKKFSESDIFLVGSLLKMFFSSLPDTLLPSSISPEVQTCMAIDDPVMRKNYMHGLLYKLPDAQYWTLRSLLFHLKRVIAHEESNKMNLKAVCVIWGPTIVPPSNDDVNDVNYQIAAMEVLINVAEQAFEPE
ncbi:GTPase-activating protein RGD1 KNAG_0C01880 [Huiozyma naganishii CBS 8797]|uniref:Rho-GAP domain-containing protein n=1 Tax=Huiozyma naganishii (strain ATCC MYA-139 / BCRC 22969 / CBS 8797 / KCTC 17520 / NBRC 10181 / NCYC 3082 / Yp74L-3) TaxID=1071383 RepID=J7RWC6_HUIN7|nr:hypothetical protein KNAG_0C01880 [Kazachstania naganishii CBS 8797]CCK69302.1 hypothetical protein KNAG_0C01880 [Kazachstania naganishii CBS 8797]